MKEFDIPHYSAITPLYLRKTVASGADESDIIENGYWRDFFNAAKELQGYCYKLSVDEYSLL
jgi:hypothetical protein